MYGEHTGTLKLLYQIGGGNWTEAWSLTGEQDSKWNSSTVMVPYNWAMAYNGFR